MSIQETIKNMVIFTLFFVPFMLLLDWILGSPINKEAVFNHIIVGMIIGLLIFRIFPSKKT